LKLHFKSFEDASRRHERILGKKHLELKLRDHVRPASFQPVPGRSGRVLPGRRAPTPGHGVLAARGRRLLARVPPAAAAGHVPGTATTSANVPSTTGHGHATTATTSDNLRVTTDLLDQQPAAATNLPGPATARTVPLQQPVSGQPQPVLSQQPGHQQPETQQQRLWRKQPGETQQPRRWWKQPETFERVRRWRRR